MSLRTCCTHTSDPNRGDSRVIASSATISISFSARCTYHTHTPHTSRTHTYTQHTSHTYRWHVKCPHQHGNVGIAHVRTKQCCLCHACAQRSHTTASSKHTYIYVSSHTDACGVVECHAYRRVGMSQVDAKVERALSRRSRLVARHGGGSSSNDPSLQLATTISFSVRRKCLW
jgi:hypothetical protein